MPLACKGKGGRGSRRAERVAGGMGSAGASPSRIARLARETHPKRAVFALLCVLCETYGLGGGFILRAGDASFKTGNASNPSTLVQKGDGNARFYGRTLGAVRPRADPRRRAGRR